METEHEYQVVARRYRPQLFDQLVGQEEVARTLSNAILNNRIGHAYLFTGARGVGKTSTARIFAKALNCIHGPTVTPCNVCEICQGISTGEDLDVLEIDGASNRGINEIRMLRQNVNIRPVRARFKIFIIDEVHMLTMEAFNALLKTLEEPPEYVKFIFCTTEVGKIPITILSRCLKFEFSGIQTSEIARRLKEIVVSEGLEADDDAMMLLARRAAGSMRDGQSLLEQLLSFAPSHITLQDVLQLLGMVREDVLIALLRDLTQHDAANVLRTVEMAIQQGSESGLLLEQLFGFFRDMMVLQAGCGGESLLYASRTHEETLRKCAQEWGMDAILAAMQMIDHTLGRMKLSTQSRLLMEMVLVRISSLQNWVNLANFVGQLQEKTPIKENRPIETRPIQELEPPREGIVPPPGLLRSFSSEQKPEPTGEVSSAAIPITPQPPVEQEEPRKPAPALAEEPLPDAEEESAMPASLGEAISPEKVLIQAISDNNLEYADALKDFQSLEVRESGALWEVLYPTKYRFAVSKSEEAGVPEVLAKGLSEWRKKSVTVKFVLEEAPAEKKPRNLLEESNRCLDHPLIRAAEEILGGKVIRTEPLS
ncbi:MAG: DNA polymerase III subunit gamma/tau [Planctomycetia bacterium]|nr:DNA polymerase III subunit gamma/tau [Planctomycetia bacterium]